MTAVKQLIRQPQREALQGAGTVGGLGRQYAPDVRDLRHLLTEDRMRSVPKGTTLRRRKRPWGVGPILDQGNTNQCTVYSAIQQIQSAPRFERLGLTPQHMDAIYREALRTDEFQGEADEGTSERAVQMILINIQTLKRLGIPLPTAKGVARAFNREFLLVDDEDIAREYLLTRGMLLQGTDWFTGFDSPDRHGYVEPTGTVRGGHEYVRRWHYGPTHYKYPDTDEYVNQWGEGYGDKGLVRMKSDVTKYIVQTLNGDLISAVEAV